MLAVWCIRREDSIRGPPGVCEGVLEGVYIGCEKGCRECIRV